MTSEAAAKFLGGILIALGMTLLIYWGSQILEAASSLPYAWEWFKVYVLGGLEILGSSILIAFGCFFLQYKRGPLF